MNIQQVPVNYRRDIETAAELLKQEGCKSISLFGSLITAKAHSDSDIDIDTSGLPRNRFFSAYSKLDSRLFHRFDLVDFDTSREFYDLLKQLNEVIEIG